MTREIPNRRNFEDELICLLNKYSKENGSNTPDFILADYLIKCLESWNLSVVSREEWYGRKFRSGSIRAQGETQLRGRTLDEDGKIQFSTDRPPPPIAREIAARVWHDQEMRNCVMDVDAAEAIAGIVDSVRRNQADAKSYKNLADSGGIVDAP